MQAIKSTATQRAASLLLSALLAFPSYVLAQDQSAPAPPPPPAASANDAPPAPTPEPAPAATGGWKRVGDQSTPDPAAQQQPGPTVDPNSVPVQTPPPPMPQQQPPPPQQQQPQTYGGPVYQGPPPPQGYPQNYPQQQQQGPPMYSQQAPPPVPPSLTMAAGTYLTVRINQMLSSDRNHEGDPFSATLTKPLVVNGVVVAEPGQTLGGRVVQAVKAGRVEGLAKLGVQLTDLALVDGQQMPIKTSLVSRTGPSSVGQDAGTIVGTTALGAAVGAAAAWGKGAAIGAGSGALLGIVGVLVTRGHPSILYPEQMLTFRIEEPVTISTEHAPQAFRWVEPGEYQGPGGGAYGSYTAAPYPAAGYPPAAYPAPAPYYYGYPYPYYAYGYGYPYYWGPGFSLFLGGRYYGGGYRYYGGGPVGRVGIGAGARIGGGGGRR